MLKRIIALVICIAIFAVAIASPVFAAPQKFAGSSVNTNTNTFAITRSIPVGTLAQVFILAQQYYRLQLKEGGKYLDASFCSDNVKLGNFSDFANGACQLWRLIPEPTAPQPPDPDPDPLPPICARFPDLPQCDPR